MEEYHNILGEMSLTEVLEANLPPSYQYGDNYDLPLSPLEMTSFAEDYQTKIEIEVSTTKSNSPRQLNHTAISQFERTMTHSKIRNCETETTMAVESILPKQPNHTAVSQYERTMTHSETEVAMSVDSISPLQTTTESETQDYYQSSETKENEADVTMAIESILPNQTNQFGFSQCERTKGNNRRGPKSKLTLEEKRELNKQKEQERRNSRKSSMEMLKLSLTNPPKNIKDIITACYNEIQDTIFKIHELDAAEDENIDAKRKIIYLQNNPDLHNHI